MSTLKLDTLSNFAGTKSIPANTVIDGSAKAWVNFEGLGTVNIRRSMNVSSVTDLGIGQYSINFLVPFPNTSYAAHVTHSSVASGVSGSYLTLFNTAFFYIATLAGANVVDPTVVAVSVFH